MIPLRVLVFGDLHISSVPPRGRTDSYIEDLTQMVGQVGEYATTFRPQVRATVGDVFHRKARTTAEDIIHATRILEPLRPIYSVSGNHDGHASDIEKRSGYGVLAHAGILLDVDTDGVDEDPRHIRVIRSTPDAYYLILGIPYRLAVTDRYRQEVTTSIRRKNITEPGTLAGILILSHLDEEPAEFEHLLRMIRAANGVGSDTPLVVCNGHLHDRTEHLILSSGSLIYTGALSRTSLNEINREPVCWAITFNPNGAERLRVKCLPISPMLVAETFVGMGEEDEDQAERLDTPSPEDLTRFAEMLKGDSGTDGFNAIDAVKSLASASSATEGATREAVRLLREVVS